MFVITLEDRVKVMIDAQVPETIAKGEGRSIEDLMSCTLLDGHGCRIRHVRTGDGFTVITAMLKARPFTMRSGS